MCRLQVVYTDAYIFFEVLANLKLDEAQILLSLFTEYIYSVHIYGI